MIKIVTICKETGLRVRKSELMLEVDFMPGKNGSLPPAMRDSPEYKIASANRPTRLAFKSGLGERQECRRYNQR